MTAQQRPAALIANEAAGGWSRKSIALAAGLGVIEAGTVLGRINGKGFWAPYDPDASDGRETARAVLASRGITAEGPAPATAIVRDARLIGAALLGLDDAAKTDLERQGIFINDTRH